MRLRFGECVFDGPARQVAREGRVIPLTPKAFRLLEALLERRPRVVPREELHDLLWPGTFVSHTSLPRLVTELRKALGDQTRTPRFLRTAHGFGYAFAGEAAELGAEEPPKPPAECGLLWKGRTLTLGEGENVLGRSSECAIRVDQAKVSRLHARILVAGSQAVIEDLASKNGTFVSGRRVTGPVRLALGDEICLGSTVLVFCALASSDTTATDHTD
ncbi:MAG: winged helix-turn-helix domain-containing protein [Acidobacteria bacterium]|nr:winged helix-turn-helix domain-containing protein [Acidobacteriota bacterium]